MIYVMSDIHGHKSRYESIMRQINLQATDHLYVLGDCIDRHPYGLEIMETLYCMPNTTLLLGNHEHMMLEALTKKDCSYKQMWYGNGGSITHEVYKNYPKKHRDKILAILKQMQINVELNCNGIDYLLVHGAPLGYKHKFGDPIVTSVWTRLTWYSSLPTTRTVIFGHTPTHHFQSAYPPKIYYGKQMIGIDCGCAYQADGRLACLRLDDMQEFYSYEDDSPTYKKCTFENNNSQMYISPF